VEGVLKVDRPLPEDRGRLLALAEQGQRGDEDGHLGADRADPAVRVAAGLAGEHKVAEQIGPHLAESARIVGIRRLDGIAQLSQPVHDALGKNRRDDRDHLRHAVLELSTAHRALLASLLMPLLERDLRDARRGSPREPSKPARGDSIRPLEHGRFVVDTTPIITDQQPLAHDHSSMGHTQRSAFQSMQRHREALDQIPRLRDLRPDRTIGHPPGDRDLRRHRPHHRIRRHPGARLGESRLHKAHELDRLLGEQRGTCGLDPAQPLHAVAERTDRGELGHHELEQEIHVRGMRIDRDRLRRDRCLFE
jgi:hypothetical protein